MMFRQLLLFVSLFTVAMPSAQTQVGTARPLIETIKGEQAIELPLAPTEKSTGVPVQTDLDIG